MNQGSTDGSMQWSLVSLHCILCFKVQKEQVGHVTYQPASQRRVNEGERLFLKGSFESEKKK